MSDTTRARVCLALLALSAGPAAAQQVLRDGFGGSGPVWVKGESDARLTLQEHSLTGTHAHSPPTAEYFKFQAELGDRVLFDYPVPRTPVAEETSVNVWVRGTKPGIQLRVRLVLPHERNPARLDEPLTAVLEGDKYQLAGRWQKLELPRPAKLARQKQQLMQVELKRPVDFKDAYIDRVMLNLYTGPGTSEVWVDDLEVGPLAPAEPGRTAPAPVPPPAAGPGSGEPVVTPALPAGPRPERPVVELNRERLQVGGKSFMFRAVRNVGAPPSALRDAGFNTLVLGPDADPKLAEQAANAGLWLVPTLSDADPGPATGTLTGRGPAPADLVSRTVSGFPAADAVLFWNLGGGRAFEQERQVARMASLVRSADPNRPLTADVWDGLWPYSRHLDLVGTHRFPLMTSLELMSYRDWLTQRRVLARPGTFVWTWVQAHAPEWAAGLGDEGADLTPQPEQLRLLTYVALSAGCRGIGFWADERLADPKAGRPSLLAMALLNQELQMLEPLLLGLNQTPTWVPGYPADERGTKGRYPFGDVQAAVLRAERGILVLPAWLGGGAQYVPGQLATQRLALTVPLVPPTATAWQVTPGEVRALPVKREAGGVTVIVPEFGLTTAVVFTSDTDLVVKWQEQVRRTSRQAARWAYDLAAAEYERVQRTQTRLESLAPPVPDAAELLADARQRLMRARRSLEDQDFRAAYLESQRAMRPSRILMRAHWENATRTLDLPASSPYALAFATLPRHWELWREVRASRPGYDALVGGDFEVNPVPGERKPPLGEVQRRKRDKVSPPPDPRAPLPKVRAASPEPLRSDPSGDKPDAEDDEDAPAPPGAPPKGPKLLRVRALDPSWRVEQVTLDEVVMQARVVNIVPSEGKDCLQLKIEPKLQRTEAGKPIPPPTALERTFLAVSSPEVRLPPGSLARITAWVRVPRPIKASADGVMIYDSVGGEPMAVRLGIPSDWQKVTLYRRVPESGRVFVTLALTGLGVAYFDDVRIEPLVPGETGRD
jgi:hypothetical protein